MRYNRPKSLIATVSLSVLIFVTGCSDDVNVSTTAPDHQQTHVQPTLTDTTSISAQSSKTERDKNRQSSRHQQCNNALIYQLYQQHNPNLKRQVLGCGTIIKVLKDDNNGSRHQKFLVKIDDYPRITVLIAHNIDLAPRVKDVQADTPIRFYGEYIYNDKGGVVHWTHKDPASRHQDGWLVYQGQTYQ